MRDYPLDDLKFVSGEFFELVLPKEKQYLLRYFDSDDQKIFLYYYHTFRRIDRFTEHTGLVFTSRWLKILRSRYELLEEAYDNAKEMGDFSKVAEIQQGVFPIPRGSLVIIKTQKRGRKKKSDV